MELKDVIAGLRDLKSGIRVRKKAFSIIPAEHRSTWLGAGYDFEGVAEWKPGEPLQDVSLVLSFRTFPDRLYKLERTEEKEIPVIVAADVSTSMLFSVREGEHKAKLLFELVGVLGFTAVLYRDPFGLVGFSDRIEPYFKPKVSGRRVFYLVKTIFERVEALREGRERRNASFKMLFEFLISRLKRRHCLIIVSDFADVIGRDNGSIDFNLLRRLTSRHDVVAIFLD
ncbi:MAG: hypothetical protein AAB884_00715, partial [Patescibacteria group bacterium]